jgi:hypothetical protein
VIWGATVTVGSHTLPTGISGVAMLAASEHTIAAVGLNGQLWRWTIGSAEDSFLGIERSRSSHYPNKAAATALFEKTKKTP